jgi:hypothetical protein
MAPQILSWLHDTGRLTLRYLAIGVSFIPAGVLYVVFRHVGWETPLLVAVSLAFGFSMAYYVWDWVEIREPSVPPISKELALLLSDSAGENWTEGFEARRKRAEASLIAVAIEFRHQNPIELQLLLIHQNLHDVSSQLVAQATVTAEPATTRTNLGAQNAALCGITG